MQSPERERSGTIVPGTTREQDDKRLLELILETSCLS
jgi:hypothetical protein